MHCGCEVNKKKKTHASSLLVSIHRSLYVILLKFALLSVFISINVSASIETYSHLEKKLPDHPLSLAELIDIALKNNPSTRQVWWNANRAAAGLGLSKSAYYPKLGLEATIRNGRNFKFINGPDTDYTIFGADFVLSMILYDFGERSASVNAAKACLQAANWQSDWNIQKVLVRVLENAYSLLHAQETVQAAKISLEEANKVLNSAKELNRAGLTSISDVYTSQATVSQMKMDLSQQNALLDIQRGKLAASLGVIANTQLELTAIDSFHEPEKRQTDELMTLALKKRADLMAKQARLAESVFYQDKAKSAYGPKVSISGRGGANHALRDKANAAQYQVMLNFEMPIFNGFETMYRNRIAYADTMLSMEALAELELEIAFEVLLHSRSLQAAQEMLPEAHEFLVNAKKSYESVLEKYRAGKERISEISHAMSQLSAARVRYSDVKTRLLISSANLAYATGVLLEIPCE